MIDTSEVWEALGVYAGRGAAKGNVVAEESANTVLIGLRGLQLEMTPEAAIVLARMLSRCARRVIARRTP